MFLGVRCHLTLVDNHPECGHLLFVYGFIPSSMAGWQSLSLCVPFFIYVCLLFCVCVCACTHRCRCMCAVSHTMVHMWKSEDNLQGQSSVCSCPPLWYSPAGEWASGDSPLPSPVHQSASISAWVLGIQTYLHASVTRTLPTAHLYNLKFLPFKWKINPSGVGSNPTSLLKLFCKCLTSKYTYVLGTASLGLQSIFHLNRAHSSFCSLW